MPASFSTVSTIDSTTGELTIADRTNLDYETTTQYTLTLRVSDGVNDSIAQTIAIDVLEVDEFDTTPISDSNGASDAVDENAAAGTTVGITAFANDGDETDGITYSLDDDAGGRFAINAATGEITTSSVLDYEAAAGYTINVRASSTDGSSTTRAFAISVNDLNDIAPVITPGQAMTIVEGGVPGTVVGSLIATDTDTVGSLQAWTITGGDPQGAFNVDAQTGAITVANGTVLDFEGQTQYVLTLQVGDGANTATPQTVVVALLNRNESPFDVQLTPSVIDEQIDTTGGHPVGMLTASDPDAGETFSWHIVGGLDADVFRIDGDVLMIDDGALDFERQSNYDVRVRVTDANGLSLEEDLTINVNDRNDAPVPLPDRLTTQEDVPLVISLAVDLLANDQDQDGNTLSVTHVSQPGNGILMDNLDGTWTYQPNANFNGADSFTYGVSDGTSTRRATVTLSVLAVNDLPVITLLADSAAVENATPRLFTASVTDIDNDEVLFSLSGTDARFFSIDPVTGALVFMRAPNFESPIDANADNTYEIEVVATDAAGGQVLQSLQVHVGNVNEAPTVVESTLTVQAGTSGVLGRLETSDPDAGDVLALRITGGSGQAFFGIDEASGEIRALGDLPAGSYTLMVEASDASGLTATGSITILVEPTAEPVPEPLMQTLETPVRQFVTILVESAANAEVVTAAHEFTDGTVDTVEGELEISSLNERLAGGSYGKPAPASEAR